MNKNDRIQIRVTPAEKKEFKKRAKEKGFRNMSDFIFCLLKNSSKLIISVGLFFLVGCATVDFLPSGNLQNFSPTQSVEVFYETPQRPYTVLGKIITEDYAAIQTNTGLLQYARNKAMQIGADALIVKNTEPAGTSNYGEIIHRFEALAIKWQSNSTNSPSSTPK